MAYKDYSGDSEDNNGNEVLDNPLRVQSTQIWGT